MLIFRRKTDLSVGGHDFLSASEKERNAPKGRQGNDHVDHAAENRSLTAKKPGNKVNAEKSDATPVKSADNCKNKRYSIEHNIIVLSKFRCFVFCDGSILPTPKKKIHAQER